MTHFLSNSEEETKVFARHIAKKLKGGDIVALKGEMGSGKTTFVRGLYSGLGGDDQSSVTSPTFTLLNQYSVSCGLLLNHYDLYRLEREVELERIGFFDIFNDEQNRSTIAVIEWGDKFSEIEKKSTYVISLEIKSKERRQITVVDQTVKEVPQPQ